MNVGQREEHLVRARIDRHGVGAVRQERPAKLIQRAAPPAEDSNDAALGRHVEPAQTGIKGEHVGLVADREARRHPPRSQVEHHEPRVVFAGDERQARGSIDHQPMVAGAVAADRYPPLDAARHRVDDRELSTRLHVDQHPAVDRVVLDIARAAPNGTVSTSRPLAASTTVSLRFRPPSLTRTPSPCRGRRRSRPGNRRS